MSDLPPTISNLHTAPEIVSIEYFRTLSQQIHRHISQRGLTALGLCGNGTYNLRSAHGADGAGAA